MQRVILDTDIGIDCDDAAALGVLLESEAQLLGRILEKLLTYSG